MKIDDDIEALAAQLAGKRHVIGQPRKTAWPLGDNDAIEMWIVFDNRCRGALHEIPERGVGIMAPQRGNGRCRERDIANEAQADQEKFQGSTVASSISITGMSSLMGYTR